MFEYLRIYATDRLDLRKAGLQWQWMHEIFASCVLAVLAISFAPPVHAQSCPSYAPAGSVCAPITLGPEQYFVAVPPGYEEAVSSEAAAVAHIVEAWENTACPNDPGTVTQTAQGTWWTDEWFGGFQTHDVRQYSFVGYNGYPDCDEPVNIDVPFLMRRDLICPTGFEIVANSTNTQAVCYGETTTEDEIKNLGGCPSPPPPPADPDPNPPEECPLAGNPINVATLNKFETQTDYAGSGTHPLVFTRYYNSRSSLPNTAPPAGARDSNYLGVGWTATYFQFLHFTSYSGTTYVVAYRPDGRGIRFSGTTGTYASEADITSVLTKTSSGWTLKAPDGTLETYAADGRLLSVRAQQGETHWLNYSSNQLVSVSDDFGHVLQFEYTSGSANAQIAALVDPAGQRTYYSTAANLTQVTYPDGNSRKYVYRSGDSVPHLLTGIIDENNSRYSYYEYDTSEHGYAQETRLAGDLNKYVVSGNPTGGWITVTEPSGNERIVAISTVRGVRRIEGSGGFCSSCPPPDYFTYDANGNVNLRGDANGYETTYIYNLSRNLQTSRTDAAGTPRARTITTQWHSTFRLPTLITEPKRKTAFTYDSNGNVLTRTVTDTSVTPNTSRTWTYTYDAFGRVLTEDGPRTTVADVTTYTYYTCASGAHCGRVHTITNAVGHVTTFNSYNAHGQPTSITDPNGVVTTIAYDLRQRVTSQTKGTETTAREYWPTGLLKKVELPDGTWLQYIYDAAHRQIETYDSAGNKIVYTLDDAGNRIGEDRFDPSGALARAESRTYNLEGQLWQSISASTSGSQVTEYTYDSAGNEISKLDPLGRSITKIYDELNRLKEVTEAGGGLITYGYDGLDNVTSVTDPRNRITTYTVNGLGDLTKIVSPDTGTTNMTYGENGKLLTRQDARGITRSYSYDAANRVATVDFGDQLLTYTYDAGLNAAGRLTSIADAVHSQSWAYDAEGRVASTTQVVGASSSTTTYAYTGTLLTTLTTPAGHSIGYTYTDGKVSSISVNGTVLLSDVLREPFGGLRQWTWGNSSLMVRTYDMDGRLTLIDSGGVLRDLDYDEAGRVIANAYVGSPSLSWTYDYSDDDHLIAAQRSGATYGWTYDANGNRRTQTGVAATNSTIASTSNRMTASTGALARTYTYDAAGNIKTFSNRVLTYNNRGRLSSIAVGGVTTSYLYNAFGRRVKKTGAQTVYFVYDDLGHLLGEYDGSGALIQELVWLDDIPVATLRPNGSGGIEVFYIHADHLNTPRRVTRASNNAAMWTWDPDAFGQAFPNENPAAQGIFKLNLRYPGQYYDSESGLHYNHHRDYDPATGRYMQSDPIGLRGGLNTYGYVGGNPIAFVDPEGLDQTAAFITCDEKGNLMPKYEPLGEKDTKCGVMRCVQEHEEQHMRDLSPFRKGICRFATPGEPINMVPRTRAQTEINAYQVSVMCLNKLLGTASCECRPRLRQLRDDAAKKMDEWRRRL